MQDLRDCASTCHVTAMANLSLLQIFLDYSRARHGRDDRSVDARDDCSNI